MRTIFFKEMNKVMVYCTQCGYELVHRFDSKEEYNDYQGDVCKCK